MEQLRIKALNVVRLIMFIIVLAMLPTVVNANEELKTNANVVGHITDKATGEPIPHVAVQVSQRYQCRGVLPSGRLAAWQANNRGSCHGIPR